MGGSKEAETKKRMKLKIQNHLPRKTRSKKLSLQCQETLANPRAKPKRKQQEKPKGKSRLRQSRKNQIRSLRNLLLQLQCLAVQLQCLAEFWPSRSAKHLHQTRDWGKRLQQLHNSQAMQQVALAWLLLLFQHSKGNWLQMLWKHLLQPGQVLQILWVWTWMQMRRRSSCNGCQRLWTWTEKGSTTKGKRRAQIWKSQLQHQLPKRNQLDFRKKPRKKTQRRKFTRRAVLSIERLRQHITVLNTLHWKGGWHLKQLWRRPQKHLLRWGLTLELALWLTLRQKLEWQWWQWNIRANV